MKAITDLQPVVSIMIFAYADKSEEKKERVQNAIEYLYFINKKYQCNYDMQLVMSNLTLKCKQVILYFNKNDCLFDETNLNRLSEKVDFLNKMAPIECCLTQKGIKQNDFTDTLMVMYEFLSKNGFKEQFPEFIAMSDALNKILVKTMPKFRVELKEQLVMSIYGIHERNCKNLILLANARNYTKSSENYGLRNQNDSLQTAITNKSKQLKVSSELLKAYDISYINRLVENKIGITKPNGTEPSQSWLDAASKVRKDLLLKAYSKKINGLNDEERTECINKILNKHQAEDTEIFAQDLSELEHNTIIQEIQIREQQK